MVMSTNILNANEKVALYGNRQKRMLWRLSEGKRRVRDKRLLAQVVQLLWEDDSANARGESEPSKSQSDPSSQIISLLNRSPDTPPTGELFYYYTLDL